MAMHNIRHEHGKVFITDVSRLFLVNPERINQVKFADKNHWFKEQDPDPDPEKMKNRRFRIQQNYADRILNVVYINITFQLFCMYRVKNELLNGGIYVFIFKKLDKIHHFFRRGRLTKSWRWWGRTWSPWRWPRRRRWPGKSRDKTRGKSHDRK